MLRGFLRPKCLARTRSDFRMILTSPAVLLRWHQVQMICRLFSRCSPPSPSGFMWSHIFISPHRIRRPQIEQRPFDRDQTRKNTRSGIAWSSFRPIHSGTSLMALISEIVPAGPGDGRRRPAPHQEAWGAACGGSLCGFHMLARLFDAAVRHASTIASLMSRRPRSFSSLRRANFKPSRNSSYLTDA
jgi:hypothetical protein